MPSEFDPPDDPALTGIPVAPYVAPRGEFDPPDDANHPLYGLPWYEQPYRIGPGPNEPFNNFVRGIITASVAAIPFVGPVAAIAVRQAIAPDTPAEIAQVRRNVEAELALHQDDPEAPGPLVALPSLADRVYGQETLMFDEYGNDISAPEGYGAELPDFGGNGYDSGVWDRIAPLAGRIFSEGGGGLPPGLTPAGFPMIAGVTGMAAAGVRTLASLFSRAGAAASFNINGIRGTIPQLWKYTRRFGPGAVAQGLGITVGALGALLLSAPDAGRRRRARGISGRDIRTTKRVVGFVSRMASQIGCVRAPRHFTKRRK